MKNIAVFALLMTSGLAARASTFKPIELMKCAWSLGALGAGGPKIHLIPDQGNPEAVLIDDGRFITANQRDAKGFFVVTSTNMHCMQLPPPQEGVLSTEEKWQVSLDLGKPDFANGSRAFEYTEQQPVPGKTNMTTFGLVEKPTEKFMPFRGNPCWDPDSKDMKRVMKVLEEKAEALLAAYPKGVKDLKPKEKSQYSVAEASCSALQNEKLEKLLVVFENPEEAKAKEAAAQAAAQAAAAQAAGRQQNEGPPPVEGGPPPGGAGPSRRQRAAPH